MQYRAARDNNDLQAILDLQRVNLPENISPAEARDQGFLTVRHDLPLLRELNHPLGHTIAVAPDGTLAGYALTMEYRFRDRIPILIPFFDKLDTLQYDGAPLTGDRYVLMGQVAVAKAYRGQGVFTGLYRTMQERMAPHYPYIVTEISLRNTRSIRAHARVGFTEIHRYTGPEGEEWSVVLLPARSG